MKRGTPLTTTAALAALLALAAAGAAAAAIPETAQRLPDPTRPPAAALQASPGAGAGSAAPEVQPQLQSVMLGGGAGSRRIAVIDGQSVRVGESFRGARVVRIADNEVELQRGRERQVLHLFVPDTADGVTRIPASAAHRTGARQ